MQLQPTPNEQFTVVEQIAFLESLFEQKLKEDRVFDELKDIRDKIKELRIIELKDQVK